MEIFLIFLTQMLGTFTGNLLLLLLLGVQIDRTQKKQLKAFRSHQELLIKESQEKMERLRRYVELES